MKKLIIIIAGVLVAAIAFSIVGAAITDSRSITMNTTPGEITNEELREFFNEHHVLLQDIADQLIPLREATGLWLIRKDNSQIVGRNGEAESVILPLEILSPLEQYFGLVGDVNEPRILVRSITSSNHPIVEFSFRLPDGVNTGILFSLDYQEGLEVLAENWQIFWWQMGTQVELCWYHNLPRWLHWVFRWVFFGWAWMCC